MAELRRIAPQAAARAPGVSEWSVGMHVEHVCLAMIGISRSLTSSEPPVPPAGFNFLRAAVFVTGRIPRGRGKAPPQALPREGIPAEALAPMLDESERWLERAHRCSSDHWYRHFAFGVLARDRALRFIGIHNRHHLRIARDILGAASRDRGAAG